MKIGTKSIHNKICNTVSIQLSDHKRIDTLLLPCNACNAKVHIGSPFPLTRKY